MNETDLARLGYTKQPDGSYHRLAPRIQTAQPEPRPVPPLDRHPQHENRRPERRRVRITIKTTRLRDPDNSVVKWLVDALRYEGIIEDDTTDHIDLTVTQEKVQNTNQEGTLIEIS